MKMPGPCPVCGMVMVNTWDEFSNKETRLNKVCSKKLNHDAHFISLTSDHNKVDLISTTYASGITAIWFMQRSELILRGKRPDCHLPFFEPDFSDYRKLLNKIKTYVLFS